MPDFWNDPNSAWTRDWANAGKAVTDLGTTLGFIPKQVDPNAPGGFLDTSNADEERARLGPLLAQLQQQAATGGGSWEQTLAAGTQAANASVQALGQSQPGAGYSSALQNIGNAQGAVGQRAVGEGNILRAQAKQGAQDQLANVLGAQGDTEANQAAAGQAAQQGIHDLQNSLNSQASKNFEGATGAIGNAFSSKMSDGGPVPGQPRVFGDDEVNDTVPAMLSPGEIVIPRSHAGSPESAADFVRALHAHRMGGQGIQHLDAGGQAGDGSGLSNGGVDAGITAAQIFLPHIGQALANQRNNSPQAPSIQNGGLMDTTNYDANRAATLQNSNLLAGRAQGNGPSIAAQQMQTGVDANIEAAMSGSRLGAGDVLNRVGAANQAVAGEGAATRAGEQTQGQQMLARALGNQRNRDLALAEQQQQAAFRNTQINAGLDLAQQAQLRNIFSGAGQAAMAHSSLGGGNPGYGDPESSIGDQPFGDTSVDLGSEPDYGDPEHSMGDGPIGDHADGMAEGGTVKVRALKPTINWRTPASVDVTALDPQNLIYNRTFKDNKVRKGAPETGDIRFEDFTVQRAHGGEITEDEAKRAADFVRALKGRRAA